MMTYPKPFDVPEDKLCPRTPFEEYDPPEFTDPIVIENGKLEGSVRWADTEDVPSDIIWNRQTFYGMKDKQSCGSTLKEAKVEVKILSKSPLHYITLPINPWKRTGICGRGLLGKWGPNHAADPIVVRLNTITLELEFVGIKRKDTGQWAIPGGMVDHGELVSSTLKREFYEETSMKTSSTYLDQIFLNPITLFKGYSDDYRNTDNAWIETTCCLFFPNDNCKHLKLCADGTEVSDVQWISFAEIHSLDLFASHKSLLHRALHVSQNILALRDRDCMTLGSHKRSRDGSYIS